MLYGLEIGNNEVTKLGFWDKKEIGIELGQAEGSTGGDVVGKFEGLSLGA